MNFAAIRAGESVFVDANVFVYSFGPDPSFGPPSRSLLERIEAGNVERGITSMDSLVVWPFSRGRLFSA